MFRLMYTSISCFSAYYLFHSAVFWPRQVFGSHVNASTKNCWDLSGSVVALGTLGKTKEMPASDSIVSYQSKHLHICCTWLVNLHDKNLDDDFDSYNSELKYFFIVQAAYQIHSLCFHLVSMGLLLLYGEGSKERRLEWLRRMFASDKRQNEQLNQRSQSQIQQSSSMRLMSMKTSMQSYARPMLEHFIVLALLIGAYLFSGLRRLGVLGIFSLEFSSVFLQLLQVCIYAPENSWWRQPKVICDISRPGIHFFLVCLMSMCCS